jgi:hypothetical protein
MTLSDKLRRAVRSVVDSLQACPHIASKTRTGTSKPKTASKKTHGDKLAGSVEKLAVVDDTPKVKSKNLNVVEEFKKSGMKRMANFVVIGKPVYPSMIWTLGVDLGRSCGSRQEYAHGPITVRSQSD